MNYIYVMSRADGAHKIGFTNAPKSRRSGISSEIGERVDIVHFVERPAGDAALVERICHVLLDERSICGEWFLVKSDEALEAVQVSCELADAGGSRIASTLPSIPRLSWKYGKLYKKILAENPGIDVEEFLNMWRVMAHLVADERRLDRYERGRAAWDKARTEGRIGRKPKVAEELMRHIRQALESIQNEG